MIKFKKIIYIIAAVLMSVAVLSFSLGNAAVAVAEDSSDSGISTVADGYVDISGSVYLLCGNSDPFLLNSPDGMYVLKFDEGGTSYDVPVAIDGSYSLLNAIPGTYTVTLSKPNADPYDYLEFTYLFSNVTLTFTDEDLPYTGVDLYYDYSFESSSYVPSLGGTYNNYSYTVFPVLVSKYGVNSTYALTVTTISNDSISYGLRTTCSRYMDSVAGTYAYNHYLYSGSTQLRHVMSYSDTWRFGDEQYDEFANPYNEINPITVTYNISTPIELTSIENGVPVYTYGTTTDRFIVRIPSKDVAVYSQDYLYWDPDPDVGYSGTYPKLIEITKTGTVDYSDYSMTWNNGDYFAAFDLSNFGGSSSDGSYEEGYQAGYSTGYSEGYNKGVQDGAEISDQQAYDQGKIAGREEYIRNVLPGEKQLSYNSGYQSGERVGYDNGVKYVYENVLPGEIDTAFREGKNAGIIETAGQGDFGWFNLFTSVIDVPVRTFTSMFDFEILGVNLAGFFFSMLSIGLVVWVVKKLL